MKGVMDNPQMRISQTPSPLTWQDIETIRIIMDKVEAERRFKPMSKEVYEEVLKQFNERKNG